jgi:hypothetical protein
LPFHLFPAPLLKVLFFSFIFGEFPSLSFFADQILFSGPTQWCYGDTQAPKVTQCDVSTHQGTPPVFFFTNQESVFSVQALHSSGMGTGGHQ